MYQGVKPSPDPSFVKRLREYDRRLSVVFDRGIERFLITRESNYGKPFAVMVVRRDDGGFRQPDQRDLKILALGDLWRGGGVKEHIRRGEERAAKYEADMERQATQEIKERGRDDKIQLMNTWRKATNQGSKAPEFRRVELNKRGKTVEQIRADRAAGRDPWAGRKVA